MKPLVYRFFDRTIALALPLEVQAEWDLLYGAFREERDAVTGDEAVCVEPEGGNVFRWEADGGVRRITRDRVMLNLQDYIQNTLLPSVQSHLLFHAALWGIEGQGMMVAGASGTGKTTLTLQEWHHGGVVFSDEIAAWSPARRMIDSFPRALAVRPDSLALVGVTHRLPRLMLDEEKALVVLPEALRDLCVSLSFAVLLDWVPEPGGADHVVELAVVADHDRWVSQVRVLGGKVVVQPHPDGGGWWRIRADRVLSSAAIEAAVRSAGAVITGWRRGGWRMPPRSGPPVVEALERRWMAERLLGEVINARSWAGRHGAASLMAEVGKMLQGVTCLSCIPGDLPTTRARLSRLTGL